MIVITVVIESRDDASQTLSLEVVPCGLVQALMLHLTFDVAISRAALTLYATEHTLAARSKGCA